MEKESREKQIYAKEMQEEGKKLFFENRVKEAAEMTRRSADLFAEIGDWHEYSSSVNSLGVIYDALGNFDLSGSTYLRALEVAEKYHYSDMLATIYNNIGSEYQDFHDAKTAKKYFDLSLESMSPEDYMVNKKQLSLIINMNISECYAELGEMDKAIEYLGRARAFTGMEDTEEQAFSFRAFESKILWKTGQEEYVRAHIGELVDIALGTVNVVDFRENIEDVCETLFFAKDYEHLRQVIEHCDESCSEDNIYLKIATLDLWIRYYRETGDQENFLKKCAEYYDLIRWKDNFELASRGESLTTKIELRKTEKEREQATTLSKVDTLTGVGSRVCMLEDSLAIIERSIKNDTGIGVGLLDIDFFKECNDTYGHIKGDECLQKVAKCLLETLGSNGTVYRFGGDEFLLLMENATKEFMLELANQIRNNIAALQIPNKKSPLSDFVTVSQGYTLAVAEEGDCIEHLVDLADHVLYQVKRCGRDNYRYMRLGEIIADM